MTSSRISSFIFTLLFLCFWLLPNTTFASIPVQLIQGDSVKLEQFKIGYFVDTTEKMPFEKVKQQTFQTTENRVSLGTNKRTAWLKINLENANSTATNIYLHHPYAYHNKAVELYEVVDGKLIRERQLRLDDKETLHWMYRGSAVFEIALQPQQHKTIYIKNLVYSHQWLALNLYDKNQSKRALLSQFTDIALLVGMLLALIIYNFLLFFSSRLKEHLFYACYLVCGGYWIALSYGLFADLFEAYGSSTFQGHLALGGIPIFLLLFMMTIFETKKNYPIEHWALLATLSLLIGDFFYGLIDIVGSLKNATTLASIMMAITLSVTISMLIRKHPLALFFLLGHGLFVIFSTLAVLFYKGSLEFNYINSHGVGIGIMLEALVLSLIIAYRIRTIESLKANQIDLQILASTDPLTKLFNRRHFNIAANHLLEKIKLSRQPASIAIIDIDHFKKINDTYGHALGDKAIKSVANMIKGQCRNEDILARYGGEEFVILMPGTSLKESYNVVERIRKALENSSITIDKNQLINFTISVGVAEINLDKPNLQNTIDQADKALYRAKDNGRNQSQLFAE
ncbi:MULTISPECIES: diguanylate cyclase [unclassified Neptuniibacter]|uniref:sensor domain-containing diguanylate cyclase n=1 Tax=unclassified Neptuniibacter TaxID=2630693 RepID=UPI0026E2F3E3|nr:MULTISPECIES: diguanylate cyclase [unclassified Neptuniibacter]MDO6514597.1 diguanylate cyclase [Neptuniibacter sp. 2_MG-2023]MDO6594647.1 diguanylate cyclase [Neptuniibacter sp. 1_MG-2023]